MTGLLFQTLRLLIIVIDDHSHNQDLQRQSLSNLSLRYYIDTNYRRLQRHML